MAYTLYHVRLIHACQWAVLLPKEAAESLKLAYDRWLTGDPDAPSYWTSPQLSLVFAGLVGMEIRPHDPPPDPAERMLRLQEEVVGMMRRDANAGEEWRLGDDSDPA